MNSLVALANQKEIKYGTIAHSAIVTYFASQTMDPYKKMHQFMMEENTNVLNSSTAFRMVDDSYGKPKSKCICI